MKKIITKRNIVVFLIVVCLAAGIVAIAYLNKDSHTQDTASSEQSQTPQDEQPLNLPKIKKPDLKNEYPEINPAYQVKTDFPNTIPLPSKLAIYTFEKNTFEKKDISDIASNLGFTSEPSTSKNYLGETIYSYYEGTKTLEVLSNQKIINVHTGKTYENSITIAPDRDTIQKTVNDYLKKNKLIEENEVVEILSTQPFRKDEDEGSQIFNMTEPILGISVTLTKKTDGYPIVESGSQKGNIEINLNSKLEIVTLRMSIISGITKKDEYPLKNKDQILDQLLEATLSEINVASPGELYSSSITTITVNNVQVVYVPFRDNDQTIVQPIYALKGFATFFNGHTAPVILQLPAIQSEYFKE